jgi:hypothetical protein
MTGPRTNYNSRATPRQATPVVDANGKTTSTPSPIWAPGIVIGVKLDMDKGEMEWTFNGVSGGIGFSGVQAPEGVYPAIQVGVSICFYACLPILSLHFLLSVFFFSIIVKPARSSPRRS